MSASPSIEIAGRQIGADHPPYVICELSGNHNGSLERALELIDAAAATGCDAIKIQTYTADTLTINHDGPGFRLEGGLWDGRTLYELYQEGSMPWDWHEALFAHARGIGIPLFSSPFDPTAVDLLEACGAPAYKIASFELIDLPLIRTVARTGKPIIMSTGMADLGEISEAVAVVRENSASPILLLHCTSAYPTPPEECDLRTIPHLAEAFGTLTGLSDHTMGGAVAIASVALGAVAIEKHFTLSRAEGGVDSAFSMEPDEFRAMAEACRIAWAALGRINYALTPSEAGGRDYRRSLYATADIDAGAVFTSANIRSVRPGFGLAPKYLDTIIGRPATRRVTRGEPLDWSMVG